MRFKKLKTYNIIAKRQKGAEYIIFDMIATKLTKNQFLKLQDLNKNILGEYHFISYNDTNFNWWQDITKYLTKHKIYNGVSFEIDYFGNITKY